MSLAITNIKLSKNPVNVNEQFKITVTVKEVTKESITYRLPFKLGSKKGGIK